MLKGYYYLKCGCVKYTNIYNPEVKKGCEVPGRWNVRFCKRHSYRTLSSFEEVLKRAFEEDENDNG